MSSTQVPISHSRLSRRAGIAAWWLVLAVGFAAPSAVADPTGQITEFSKGLEPGAFPAKIAPGADGNLWLTDQRIAGGIARIIPSTQWVKSWSRI